MNRHAARATLLPSSRSPLGCNDGPQIEDAYTGAHSDGYDFADYQADKIEWALMVCEVASTSAEAFLFLCAARDYKEHVERCEEYGEEPLPRAKWCDAHVAGQIDRALEIAGEV